MPDSLAQIGLILLLVVPGYLSYSLKEKWCSHKDKAQIEKLLWSLTDSVIIWIVFYWFFSKTPRYYLMEGSLTELLRFWPFFCLIMIGFSVSYLWALTENKKWIFILGRWLGRSVKVDGGVPLIETIFNDPRKEVAEVHVYTDDGSIYRGINPGGGNGEIMFGAHPFSGDISFVCDWAKKAGEKKGRKKEITYDNKGFILRTYIPKERIKKIRYTVK